MAHIRKILIFVLVALLLAGCSSTLVDEAVPLAADSSPKSTSSPAPSPAAAPAPSPAADKYKAEKPAPEKAEEAKERLTKENDCAVIDYTDTAEGFVKVKYTGETEKRLKAQVKGPATTYTYNIQPGQWATFPLSEGDGSYKISIYENAYDSKYALVLSTQCDVKLKDEFAPFLHSNQYVDYENAKNTLAKAEELTKGMKKELEMVEAVYNYAVDNIVYDTQRAATVKSGYLPVLDSVLAEGKGICFDYAALMTGMLRSQGVPCKLVVGYAGSVYHAWISVWTAAEGWIDGVIFFDGSQWHRMDPTFASGAKSSESIMEYIGDGSNYVEKYIY